MTVDERTKGSIVDESGGTPLTTVLVSTSGEDVQRSELVGMISDVATDCTAVVRSPVLVSKIYDKRIPKLNCQYIFNV